MTATSIVVAMVVPLVVILGAGASLGAANIFTSPRPPLTLDLFDEHEYGAFLPDYDLAHQAGRYITDECTANTALALEQVLHDMRSSSHEHHKHMALAVPPYLQHLLHTVSATHYASAFRYDRLIERLLRLDYVFFVTLNYDVLLDRRLNALRHLSRFDDYIDERQNWSLIKLHGSVNWYHPASQHSPYLPPKDLDWDSSDFQCVAPNADLATVRGAPLGGAHTTRYPALALPEGPNDRLVLPREHLQFFQSKLQSAHEIDVLVIGYSGLDQEVLKLLVQTTRKVRRMTVVSRDHATAKAVFDRFRAAGINPVWDEVIDGSFGSWTDGGGLNKLVDEYGGPYR